MQGQLIYEDRAREISISIMARANAHGPDAAYRRWPGPMTSVISSLSGPVPRIGVSHRSFRTTPPAKFGCPATNRRAPGEIQRNNWENTYEVSSASRPG